MSCLARVTVPMHRSMQGLKVGGGLMDKVALTRTTSWCMVTLTEKEISQVRSMHLWS